GSWASTTKCPTSWRSRLRANGTTTEGASRATEAPTPSNARSTGERKPPAAEAESLPSSRAATCRSSGRATRSTNFTARSRPSGSETSAARRPEVRDSLAVVDCAVARAHRCASSTAGSTTESIVASVMHPSCDAARRPVLSYLPGRARPPRPILLKSSLRGATINARYGLSFRTGRARAHGVPCGRTAGATHAPRLRGHRYSSRPRGHPRAARAHPGDDRAVPVPDHHHVLRQRRHRRLRGRQRRLRRAHQ